MISGLEMSMGEAGERTGILSPEYEKQYETLRGILEGHAGEHVLVVSQSVYQHGLKAVPLACVDTTLKLGVLTSNELEIGDVGVVRGTKNIILSTGKYAERYPSQTLRWELREGPMILDWYKDNLADLNRRQPIKNYGPLGDLSINLENISASFVDVGTEVGQFFMTPGFPWGIISYGLALEMLEEKVPEEFRKLYEAGMSEATSNVLNRLRWVSGVMELGSTNSIGAKRQQLEQEIRFHLKHAVDLRLHERELELEIEPGITIKVPEYVSEMCRIYEVQA